jgi:hypothetical protein
LHASVMEWQEEICQYDTLCTWEFWYYVSYQMPFTLEIIESPFIAQFWK